jgi:hypothetical protein
MADVSAKNSVNVTNEVKPRPAFDFSEEASFGGAQFLDLVMARLTALGSADAEIKDVVKKYEAAPEASREASYLKHAHGVKKSKKAAQGEPVAEKDKIKAQIKDKIAEIIARDDTPVSDDRAVKLLKKVADFLIKAEEQGKIDLPEELALALQVFLDQPEMKAAHLADFMSEFISLFRQLNLVQQSAKPAAPADGAAPVDGAEAEPEFVWPKEIADAFAELKLGGLAKEGREISLVDAVVAVKALVNAAQNAGVDTLKEKAELALAGQSQAATEVGAKAVPAVDAKPELKPELKTKAAAPVKAPADSAEIIAVKIAAGIVKPVETAVVQKAVEANAAPAAVVAPALPAKPASADALSSEKPLLDLSGPESDAALPEDESESLTDLLLRKALPAQEDEDKNKNKDKSASREAAAQSNNGQSNAASAARSQIAANIAPGKSEAVALAPAADAGLVAAPTEDGIAAAPALANAAKFAKAINAPQQAGQSPATQQVVVHIKNNAGKSSQLSIQLSPAELGRVELRLNIQRDGSTHVVVSVDKPETLALLQKDAASLEKALQQAGLNANQENMSFNLREQRDNKGGFSGKKRLSGEAEEAKVKELALNVHSDGKIISDTRVNYHA